MSRLFYPMLLFMFWSCDNDVSQQNLGNYVDFEVLSLLSDNQYASNAASILDLNVENTWVSQEDGRLDITQNIYLRVILENDEVVNLSFSFLDKKTDKNNVTIAEEDPITRLREWTWNNPETIDEDFYHHLNEAKFIVDGLKENYSTDQLEDLFVEPVTLDGQQRYVLRARLDKTIYQRTGAEKIEAYEVNGGKFVLLL